jgi:hypothetical protein
MPGWALEIRVGDDNKKMLKVRIKETQWCLNIWKNHEFLCISVICIESWTYHLVCCFMFTCLLESGLHKKMTYCATWMRESSMNLLMEIVTQALNIVYVRISMLVLWHLNM